MPNGPRGEKRPADVIGAAVMVARIATGEITDNLNSGLVNSGHARCETRAKKLPAKKRGDIAKKPATARGQA